ncbi:MAG: hypothetical protein IPJ38_00710 [Dechloromonas sp.]|uniref:Uncharacterized protein n=1 Tax=Candidatus Dechloromonas phosphorivorans TaxID=2899244 RepID=A0A935N1R0_9RHOO|nr:hypothetical protein [Candidatus Dechloromonas phosphorivorans]
MWIKLSGYQLELPNKNLIFTAKRIDIEDSLRDEKILGSKKTDVENWPRWSEVKKIKEISEGFKHRQRLQPFPNEAHSRKTPAWMTQRLVEPDNENWLVNYELSLTDVVGYVDAVGELLYWLKSNRMF